MTPWHTLLVIVLWIVPIFAGWRVGAWKGRVVLGILLGVFLGWLGVIITACVPKSHERKAADAAARQQIEREAVSE